MSALYENQGRERPLQPPEHGYSCPCRSCRLDRDEAMADDAYERYVQRELDEQA